MDNQDQVETKIPGIDDDLPPLPIPDELTSLKEKADLMGLSYHPSIGLEKLRAKVAEAIAAEGAPRRSADVPDIVEPAPVPVQAYQAASLAPAPLQANQFIPPVVVYVNPKKHADSVSEPVVGETANQIRVRLKRHAMELIRVHITCMDPSKKEWDGEIVTTGNNLVGTVSKYIPFGIDEGWHVPRILYNVLRDRMAQVFITTTDPKTKQKVRTGKLIKAFNIEVLEPLNQEELNELAARQAATRAID